MAQKKRKHMNLAKLPGYTLADMMALKGDMVRQATENAKSETQRILADRQAQRVGWMYICALNEAFGFGAERIEKLEAIVQELSDDYAKTAKDDQLVADERLRRWVSKIKGHEVNYLYEDLYPVNTGGDPSAQICQSARELDSRIY